MINTISAFLCQGRYVILYKVQKKRKKSKKRNNQQQTTRPRRFLVARHIAVANGVRFRQNEKYILKKCSQRRKRC